MNIKDSVVFVTGANRGLGLAFVHELLARGAKKVYAGVRDPSSIDIPKVVPVKLDVTKPAHIAAAAKLCDDTTILINNAGIASVAGYLDDNAVEVARQTFEVNYFGPLNMSRAFAPILKANGGGAIVNVLSIVSWLGSTVLAPYSASKSAAWSLTNTLRQHLREQGTQVLGLHVGYIDTDLTKGFDVPKISPEDVVRQTIDGVEAGREEVLADEGTRAVKLGLSAEPAVYLAPV
jgi:NAD(P)-dependent dehydrogenase (short-subunit alcohol dehydrogenase family)